MPDDVEEPDSTDYFEELGRIPPIVNKVLLLGSSGVGKTSILARQVKSKFKHGSMMKATIGAVNTQTIVELPECDVVMQVWDTAGQERYRSMVSMYYRNSAAILLVYDVTNKKSFDDLAHWINDISLYGTDDPVIFIIGNKTDLTGQRCVSFSMGSTFTESVGGTFYETSAVDNEGIEMCFFDLATILCDLRNRDSCSPREISVCSTSTPIALYQKKSSFVYTTEMEDLETDPGVESRKFCNCN